jgi:hypothetical protein
VSWLFLGALGMMWAAFLLPSERRKGSPRASVEDFERKMELLADTESQGQGRWIITPRKGVRFIGPQARAQARARERRRKVFVFFIESIGLTFLIGLVPPLRTVWLATGGLVGLLALYVWLLVSLKHRGPYAETRERNRQVAAPAAPHRAPRERYISGGRHARPAFNGLGALGADDLVNIVVKPAREVGIAGV